ncbi:MAG: PTS transporter subunit EIIC [Holdemanella sp.]|nr:PTS transporter subunit EIIC [Holdemanella sp.]
MAKKDYSALADEILIKAGGKENITACMRCATRLRLHLKDVDKINLNEFEHLGGAFGAKIVGNQLQIIYGNSVGDITNAVAKAGNFETKLIDEKIDNVPEKRTVKDYFKSFFTTVSECVVPMMPVLIGTGMLILVLQLLTQFGVMSPEGSTYKVLYCASQVGFYYMTVYAGMFTAKKFGGNQGVAMALMLLLLYPDFVAMLSSGATITVFGLPITNATYSSTILPGILSIYVMCKVEKFLDKYTPDSLKLLIVPFVTFIVMIPIELVVLAPLGSVLGNYLAIGIMGLYNTAGPFGVMISAAIMPLAVMTGMHYAFFPYLFMAFSTIGYEPIVYNSTVLNNFAIMAVCIALLIRAKSAERRTYIISCGTPIIMATSEPALFGILMKEPSALIATMIGSGVGGFILGLLKVVMYRYVPNTGILAFTGYYQAGTNNFMYFLIGLAATMIVSFMLTFVLYKNKEENQ